MRLADSFVLTSAFQSKHCFALASRPRTQYARYLCVANRFGDKETKDAFRKTHTSPRLRGIFDSLNENRLKVNTFCDQLTIDEKFGVLSWEMVIYSAYAS
ncbi:hypothetical protein AVEN_254740-1 [Araneus ventricosus]|uniref:Uncharacterized protein n=1 Tax=Araneus ventricosus TaxID=182803 RepID=A0A4Y2KAS1_ARAVE|nr:hypothetical protein AVEN_254740-1 [Araneus ventricosus]